MTIDNPAATVHPGSAPAIIDAHHHFWHYEPEAYPWIDPSMTVLRRDWLAVDLAPRLAAARIDGVVSVQARQTLEETSWLLSLADAHDFIVGVVGWVPLVSSSVVTTLGRFGDNPKFRGVRHVVQGEADPHFLERPDFNAGIRALRPLQLSYDILIYETQIPAALDFVDRHPDQVFIVDHAAKPRIRDGVLEPWRTNVRELARRPGVYCKLSGLVTEAATHAWTDADLRPYVDTVLEAFGPTRVMFGSDWPVCLLASSYDRWFDAVRRFLAELTPTERASILGGSARRAYRL
ncbi:MAG: amidohydrolase family protein [Polyangiaceae bacterium]